jgi:hydrogenase/urease accessory protein HupE
MEWDYRGDTATDAGAASIATVIIAVMAPGHGHQPGHDPGISHPQRGRDHL